MGDNIYLFTLPIQNSPAFQNLLAFFSLSLLQQILERKLCLELNRGISCNGQNVSPWETIVSKATYLSGLYLLWLIHIFPTLVPLSSLVFANCWSMAMHSLFRRVFNLTWPTHTKKKTSEKLKHNTIRQGSEVKQGLSC